jgi:hypothetical protein
MWRACPCGFTGATDDEAGMVQGARLEAQGNQIYLVKVDSRISLPLYAKHIIITIIQYVMKGDAKGDRRIDNISLALRCPIPVTSISSPLATFHDDYMRNYSSQRMKETVHSDYPIKAS